MANITKINGKNIKDSTAARMASLAPIEASTTATVAHAVGEYFWLGDTLYEATAAIAVGGTITVGTNCKAAVLGDSVADLKSQMGAKASTDMALGAYPTDSTSGGIVTFADGADSIPVKDLTIGIEPVQSGSGDPSPDNVRPISGWTGANVTRCRNLLDSDTLYATYKQTDGSYIATGRNFAAVSYYIPAMLVGVTVTFSAALRIVTDSAIIKLRVAAYINGTQQNGNFVNSSNYVRSSITFVPTSTDDFVLITYGSSGSHNMQAKDIQLEVGQLTDYVPYAPVVYPITFPAEAGIVCAGTLDVTTGLLTVTHIRQDFTGANSEFWVVDGNGDYVAQAPLIKRGTTPISSAYLMQTVPPTGLYVIRPIGNNTDFSTMDAWKAYLAQNPLQICYQLDTPATYQCTPAEVLTILGANTVYADTGDILSLTYRADPTLYADKRSTATRSIIAGIEPTMKASKAYTVGQLLIVGDTLYKVAASIASDATLTPGTNVNPTTVAEQLILLANA